MWTFLNDVGRKVWGEVFPDGQVPVCSMHFFNAFLGGSVGIEKVVLVNWSLLTVEQRDQIVSKISKKAQAPKEAVLKDILRIGLPLRKIHTNGAIVEELRFFV